MLHTDSSSRICPCAANCSSWEAGASHWEGNGLPLLEAELSAIPTLQSLLLPCNVILRSKFFCRTSDLFVFVWPLLLWLLLSTSVTNSWSMKPSCDQHKKIFIKTLPGWSRFFLEKLLKKSQLWVTPQDDVAGRSTSSQLTLKHIIWHRGRASLLQL